MVLDAATLARGRNGHRVVVVFDVRVPMQVWTGAKCLTGWGIEFGAIASITEFCHIDGDTLVNAAVAIAVDPCAFRLYES